MLVLCAQTYMGLLFCVAVSIILTVPMTTGPVKPILLQSDKFNRFVVVDVETLPVGSALKERFFSKGEHFISFTSIGVGRAGKAVGGGGAGGRPPII